jgi:MGT family glycosyltransferase
VTGARRHFAIIAPPTPGHLNPLQALGSELVALGHRITFVHEPDVAPLIRDSDAGFEALTLPAREHRLDRYNAVLAKATGPIGLTRMIRATAVMSERLLTHGPAALQRLGADAVIADSAEPAGELLAQYLGLPCVVSITGLPLLGEADIPPPYLRWKYRADAIGRFRNRGGYMVSERMMRPATRVTERYRRAWDLDARRSDVRLHVAQCPARFDYPRSFLPQNFLYGGPWRQASSPEIDLPTDDRPLIFCSLGTLQGSRKTLFATMSGACAALGARAVIGHAGGLSPAEVAALPGSPLVRDYWPQRDLLHKCAAAILHGGFNTVLDALAAGVPIVALPIAFEQPGTAARLARLGAGEILSPRSLSQRRLARTLQRVVSTPSYRREAARLSIDIQAAGGAADAAARIDAAIA